MTELAPTPWQSRGFAVFDAEGNFVLRIETDNVSMVSEMERQSWIINAVINRVNSHADLLAACEASKEVFSSVFFGRGKKDMADLMALLINVTAKARGESEGS